MTTTVVGTIPVWTLGWRLKRALDHAGVSAQEMADELGVSRGTVSRYMNDREPIRRGYLKLWALRTGVSHDWLVSGESTPQPVQPSRLMPFSSPIPGNLDDEQGPPTTAEFADIKGALRKRIPLRPPMREPGMRTAVAG
jgi:transcriptional regulator with XRE-family HTH domain